MYGYSKPAQNPLDERITNGSVAHVGNIAFRELAVLGAGYSGEVRRVQDGNGQVYALKVSNEKHIRFAMNEVPTSNPDRCNMVLQEASEFEKMRKLYAAGVPVPRPHGFQIHTNADGNGSTSVLMELVRGQTLRDWLSERPGGKTDKLSGRSQHPAITISDAVARVDVACSIISALEKLRRLAFFADFKPRNIMIREQKLETEKSYSVCLIDIGGVVMYQDLSSDTRPSECSMHHPVLIFQPLKDRYLIETTCSYLSPEMALLIAEYDFWKRRLNNHFFRTRRETVPSCETSSSYQDIVSMITWGRKAQRNDTRAPDARVMGSYLEMRKTFEQSNVLFRAKAQCDGQQVSEDPGIPSQNDRVRVSEKSSVFTLGLILVELFGGKRTGLTSLTRLRHINDIFLGETGNAEFRMVMEWETANALLDSGSKANPPGRFVPTSTNSTRCPNSTLTSNCTVESDGKGILNYLDIGLTRKTCTERTVISARSVCTLSSISYQTAIAETENQCSQFRNAPPCPSYFELYRRHAYPHEGLLSAWPGAWDGSTGTNNPEVSGAVQQILDQSLRFEPHMRMSLSALNNRLQDLRRMLIANMAASEKSDTSALATKTTPGWGSAGDVLPLSTLISKNAKIRQIWGSRAQIAERPVCDNLYAAQRPSLD